MQLARKLIEVKDLYHERGNVAEPVPMLGTGVTCLSQGSKRQKINHSGGETLSIVSEVDIVDNKPCLGFRRCPNLHGC